ncbi:glycosyltransferase family 4 protein [Chelatococcus daeguensis]|uniref:glycosyltransferase family 4 protein n=1 Tax=Chelatococcus daeguensis TaxID=444444 RepID=UPI0007AB9289|nr:glycosyltransferase family 4 protein [Chelatococcus daeguensis]KZE27471.1 glycosyl transferase family 1 [Chelatococcus daeguensis]MBM3085689.1 glycosyltransferase family 4 protein [Chelatococcus daeguensis]
MPDVVFAIPGDLASPTGGYAYARRMLNDLPAQGIDIAHLTLAAGFPFPTDAELAATAAAFADTPRDAVLLIDGLACGALPAVLLRGCGRRCAALVHHPLGHETGLSDAARRQLLASERAALAAVDAVVATSAPTGRVLACEFCVAADRLTIAEPGTDPAPRAPADGEPPHLIAVGAVSPRKGYDVLVAALARLSTLSWRATIVGSLDRAPEEAARLRALIAGAGLAGRVALAGACDDAALERTYASADLFVMASHYEGYGMVLTEALARGLPIVTTRVGAADERVPDTAALKVPPGDTAALAAALETVLGDRERRSVMAEAAWRAGQALPRWDDAAAAIAGVIRSLAGRGRAA